MLYGCDGAWWKACNGVPQFKGIKLTQDGIAAAAYPGLHKVNVLAPECNDFLMDEPGTIGAGGNSGFQALNLAAQFGAARIVLVGFDLRIDMGLHWHGAHARGLNNPRTVTMKNWRLAFGRAAIVLANNGIDVINVSEISTLTVFRQIPFEKVFA